MKKQKTVLLGLSGGVDSAVAALLLKKQKYRVIGAFMKNFSATKNKLTGECNYLLDLKDAQKIAAKLNIPIITLDFEKEYKKYVITPLFKAYSQGLTPNPDSLCNKIIKFPMLWKEAQKIKADYIATGHYIKKVQNKDGSYSIRIPKDGKKDQSYFLYDLTQFDLKHTLFPIGESNLTKDEVRKLAEKNNLHNFDKLGSRGICFVGKVDMKNFLQQKIKPKPGKLLSTEGKVVGKHPGVFYFTIGEKLGNKYGLEIEDSYRNKKEGKLYVAEKNKKSNTIIAAHEGSPALLKKTFGIINLNWINKIPKLPLRNIKVRIRHLGELMPATIGKEQKRLICTLKKPIRGVADGQSCVIYKDKEILGGGEIRF